MTDDNAAPQFATAEFEPILVDSTAYFVRALMFGAGGALLGLALYATVVIVTNYEIGFVSLAVGWIVGKAILMGSRGRTGRRYQVAAALLTYFAVSTAIIPVAIAQLMKAPPAADATSTSGISGTNGPNGTSAATDAAGASNPTGEGQPVQVNFVAMVGTLLMFGLAAPFLGLQEMPGGLISLFILGIGVHIAWKMTGGNRAAIEQVVAGPATEEKPTTLNLNR